MIEKLPEQWCIRVEQNNKPEEVYEWRKSLNRTFYNADKWKTSGYINEIGSHSYDNYINRTELTLNDFKKLVLNQPPDNYNYLITLLKKLNIK